jgi:hypothetical protein
MKERVGFPIAEYEEISPIILGKIKVRLFPQVIILSWVVLLKKRSNNISKRPLTDGKNIKSNIRIKKISIKSNFFTIKFVCL